MPLVSLPEGRRRTAACLGLLLLAGFGLRAFGLTRPYLGHFTGVTTLYGMVARNFARDGEWLRPKFDVLVDGEPMLRMLDYPLNSAVTAVLAEVAGLGIDAAGRLTTIAVTLLSAWLLWDWLRRREGDRIAWIAAAVFLASPLTIVYGQALHADAWAVAALLAAFRLKPEGDGAGNAGGWIASCACLALAVTMRIQLAAFCLLGFGEVLWRARRAGLRWTAARLGTGIPVVLLLPILWYGYTYHMASVDRQASMTLFHQIGKRGGEYALLLSPRFLADLADLAVTKVVGAVLVPFLVLGCFTGRDRPGSFAVAVAGLLCAAAVILVMPGKVVETDYYLYATVPFAAILVARGIVRLTETSGAGLRAGWIAVSVAAVLVNLSVAAAPAFRTPEADRGIPAAAARVRDVVPPDGRLLASHGAASDFLYYCDRRGWPLTPEPPVPGSDSYYRTDPFGVWEPARFARRRDAYRAGPIAWMEYLRAEEGATHLAWYRPPETSHPLRAHLASRYPLRLEDLLVAVYDLRERIGE